MFDFPLTTCVTSFFTFSTKVRARVDTYPTVFVSTDNIMVCVENMFLKIFNVLNVVYRTNDITFSWCEFTLHPSPRFQHVVSFVCLPQNMSETDNLHVLLVTHGVIGGVMMSSNTPKRTTLRYKYPYIIPHSIYFVIRNKLFVVGSNFVWTKYRTAQLFSVGMYMWRRVGSWYCYEDANVQSFNYQ